MSRRVIEYISMFIGALILTVSIWSINILFYPIIGVVLTGLVYLLVKKEFTIDFFDIILFTLLGYEFINYLCSVYKPNTYIALENLFLVVSVVFFLKRLLQYKDSYLLFLSISCIALLLSASNLGEFFFKFLGASYHGFDDFSQFRYLYHPLGLLSNEWVTIIISFFPFVLLTFFSIRKDQISSKQEFFNKSGMNISFWLTLALLLFNLFISFSRGGYIAFLALQLSITCLFALSKTVSLKTLVVYNLFIILFFLILSVCFSTTIQSTVFSTSSSHTRSFSGRIDQWSSAGDILRDNPWTGIGSKNYPMVAQSYNTYKPDYMFTGRVNNTFIQVIIEKGIVGSIIYLAVLIIFTLFSLRNIFKVRGDNATVAIIVLSGVFSILVRELSFSSLFYNDGLLIIFLLFLAIEIQNGYRIRLNKRWTVLFAFLSFCILTCFVYANIMQNKSQSKYHTIVDSLDNREFEQAYELAGRFNLSSSSNAVYFSLKGLTSERMLVNTFSIDSLLTQIPNASSFLLEAQENYSRSIEINPLEDMNYHNLGWIYFFMGEKDLALMNISKAIELNANSAIYYISRGLMQELKNNENESFNDYKQAIILSPDIIDSRFFKDLKLRNNTMCSEILKDVMDELNRFRKIRNNPIVNAKIGKILLYLGNFQEAEDVLSGVVKELPSLNRAWYYLGIINEECEEYDNMLDYYNRSLFLDMSDFLPRRQLALYYNGIGDRDKEKYYKETALKYYMEKSNEHSIIFERVYYLRTVRNDIIPYGLLLYVTPELDLNTNIDID